MEESLLSSDMEVVIEKSEAKTEVEDAIIASEEVEDIGEVCKEENEDEADPGNKESSSNSESGKTDPYAYLNRNEFSSERFKIEVTNLPKYYGFSELRKLFNSKLKVNAHKLIPPKKGSFHMFINFKSAEDREAALPKIDGYVWKNKTLSAKFAKAAEDPLVKKRMADDEGTKDEEGFISSDESVADVVRRVTTPWWNIPYEVQLDRKMKIITEIFNDMKKGIFQVNSQLRGKPVLDDNIVEKIRPSPITTHYRNKCEFSIGFNPDNKEKTVGFRLSSYKKGSIAVGPIDSVVHVPEIMMKSALQFQDFIQQSKYDVYNAETHQGCYRQLTVRVTRNDDVLMMVALCSKKMTNEELVTLKEEIKSKFTPEISPNVKSFYLKHLNAYGNPDNAPPELVFGTETITETLLDLKFEVSPEAFFQINIPATEVMYTAIGDVLGEQKDATLLDVCSGTGTIGISLSSKCFQVLGIELVPSAVVDARNNAKINGLSEKCDFFAGKAEDLTDIVIVRAKSEKIIAIVDPPRAGLHQKVLFTLRKSEKIETLIYVACNARAAMKNFIDLARPSSHSFKGRPFIPVKLIPVDMFPNSPHFELIIVFKRLSTMLKSLEPKEQKSSQPNEEKSSE